MGHLSAPQEALTTPNAGQVQPAGPANGRWSGYLQLVRARLRELRREPEAIFWVFVFPILLAVGLGLAFRNKPADTSWVAVVSGPNAQHAVDLLKSARDSGSVRIEVLPPGEALNRFRLGKFELVVMPQDDGRFEYRFDPARPESVLARVSVDDALQAAAGRKDVLRTSARASSEPGARYIDFLIPGILGMNLMASGLWGIGFGLVEMRQRKLLKRFVATPMRRSDFLLSIATSRLLLALLQLVLLFGFGALAFRMRVIGSWASILLIAVLGGLAFGGLGLLTACRARKIESISGIINVVMMPMWIFGGVFFSYERFPAFMHPAIKLLPLAAFNDALRAVVLEGASLAAQQMRLLVLCVWGLLSFVLALRWFRWT